MPAYFPFLSTQIYRSPSLEKHSYTRSIGDCISRATGACYMLDYAATIIIKVPRNSPDQYTA